MSTNMRASFRDWEVIIVYIFKANPALSSTTRNSVTRKRVWDNALAKWLCLELPTLALLFLLGL
jgi:hypothetical protein